MEAAPEIEIADAEVPLAPGPVEEPASSRNIPTPLVLCVVLIPVMMLAIWLVIRKKQPIE